VLWNAVRTDVLSAISTDHCAFLRDGQKTMGKDDFSKIPNGGPGLENRLHMIHHFGVGEGRIQPDGRAPLHESGETVRPLSAEGDVAPGSDADLVIFDPSRRKVITAAEQHSRTDYNLYEGTEVTGDVDTVLVRGTVVVADGKPGRAGVRRLRRARPLRRGAAPHAGRA
jgi:dihydropyrimidinase